MTRLIQWSVVAVLCLMVLAGYSALFSFDEDTGRDVTTTQNLDKSRLRLAPELTSDTWLNGEPTTLKALRGQGLTIIGLHSPEFDYEQQTGNVETVITHFGIPYRVALDNDFHNWHNFRNRYWPSLYRIDKQGYIGFNHIGEGDYERIEAMIRQLLAEL